MKSIYEDLPPVEIAGRKFVGRVLFGLLVLVSALVGATAGLLLVYTTDLPQVEALEAYRPSSITELYDDHNRVIGSFALQRRVVAGYDDFAPVLRDALVSIEDKDFYRHSGINFWRIIGAAYRDIESGGKVQGASTLTMQLGAQPLSFARPFVPSQSARDDARHSDRAPLHQAANFHPIRQPDFPRSRRIRFRGGFGVLLQQARQKSYPHRGCAPRWSAQRSRSLFAHQSSRSRNETPQSRDQCHARGWKNYGDSRRPMPVRRPWFCICSTIPTRSRLISSKKSAAILKTSMAPTRYTKAD
jgi:hypothetical protein